VNLRNVLRSSEDAGGEGLSEMRVKSINGVGGVVQVFHESIEVLVCNSAPSEPYEKQQQ
jgi:hypothetical protein